LTSLWPATERKRSVTPLGRSLILRITHSARDRHEPFHRMIGIDLGFRLPPLHAVESAGLHHDLSRQQRSFRQDRRPAAPAEMAIDRLPAAAPIRIDHGLARLLIVGFSHDEVEGEYAAALSPAVGAMTYCDCPRFALQHVTHRPA